MSNVYMRFPGGKTKAMTLSYDDGVETDARLINILNAHDMYATFNINTSLFAPEGTVYPAGTIHRRMSRTDALKLYSTNHHEVALHGAHHPFLEHQPLPILANEVLQDRLALEEMFGSIVRGMAYPYGTLNDDVVTCLRVMGIAYSRTTVSTGAFNIPDDWLRLPATCHHDDPRLFDLLDAFQKPLTGARPPRLFYLWGHSYEFDGNDNWDRIEAFCEKAAHQPDTWYATNIDVHDYVEDFRRLVFSVRGDRVENPTARTIWFETEKGDMVTVDPGKSKKF